MAVGKVIWTYFNDAWHQGDLAVMNAADHGTWLGSLVFDGARSFEGVVPDLGPHCQRANDSAHALGLKPTLSAQEMIDLTMQGLEKFAPDAAVYIRPMYWSKEGGPGVVVPDPHSTIFCLCLEQIPMAPADASQTLGRTQFVRPMISMAPVNAKAACLYPNNGRMIREAQARGFNNAIVADALGNVAESATANIFLVKDGVVKTPVPNGTFLNGITRQRVIQLLRKAGYPVEECTLGFGDFDVADEVFLTGNISKITPISKIEDRAFAIGPVTKMARELYWQWAKS
ncbi:MAG TPA: branched-chain amino acid aminotransferase [Rhodobacteraceae bacterium]|jgi:branched-chain amino acid aminotransferase|nr:branched-chain amino acid aminotransferase [Paracoccaceae bacterium]